MTDFKFDEGYIKNMAGDDNKKMVVDKAYECISQKNVAEFSKNYKDLVLRSITIAKYLGLEKAEFNKFRSEKKKRNGIFEKRYILSEKVLPVGVSVRRNKLLRDDRRDTLSGAQKMKLEFSSMGIKQIPEKLVRDRIPEIIEIQAKKNGIINYEAKVRVASQVEFPIFIKQKLDEEGNEFLAAKKVEDQLDDLVDVLDIVEAFGKTVKL